MDKINFVNGTQPAINDTNLNQMQINIENAINGTILYENEAGTNINFTLNQSEKDFKELAVYSVENYSSSKEQIPITRIDTTNKNFSISGMVFNNTKTCNFTTTYIIQDQQIKINNKASFERDYNTGNISGNLDINRILITKVIGYK